MGGYKKEWLAFEIDSKCHIMDLIIESSFAKAICFQIHQMQDNSYKVFWNFEFASQKIVSLTIQYGKDNKIDMKTPLIEIWKSNEFAKFIKQHSKIYSSDLNENVVEIVNTIIKSDWSQLPYECGLDGHSYHIKIYGEKIREYHCWCNIPGRWFDLLPLLDLLIKLADLQPEDCYRPKNVIRLSKSSKPDKHSHNKNFLELPIELPDWIK